METVLRFALSRIGLRMANVKKGNLVKSPQWWKHLREWKRVFWKAERKAGKAAVKSEVTDTNQP